MDYKPEVLPEDLLLAMEKDASHLRSKAKWGDSDILNLIATVRAARSGNEVLLREGLKKLLSYIDKGAVDPARRAECDRTVQALRYLVGS